VQQLAAHLDWLTWMLADGRKFLLGEAPSGADITVYHIIWFLRQSGGGKAEGLLPIEKLFAWYDRVAAIGHGKPQDMSRAEALAVGRNAEPTIQDGRQRADSSGVPETRQCFVKVSQCEIVDTWYTAGSRGTGSNDIAVRDIFVPERPSKRWGCYGAARLLSPGVRDEVAGHVGAGRTGWDRWRP
jgi:hypothetical protein